MPLFAVASSPDRIRRIAALQAMAILDTPPEDGFDAITRLAAMICGTPIAVIGLIDGDRLWFKSTVGIDVTTISSDTSFSAACVESGGVLEVADALVDSRLKANLLVSGHSAIRSVADAAIICGGITVGTVCVLDQVPRTWPMEALNALKDLAIVAGALMRARIEAFTMLADARR